MTETTEVRTQNDALHALAAALAKRLDPLGEGEVPWMPHGVALVLLDMPEMQAIRNVLLFLRDEAAAPATHPCYQAWYDTLPESVREWVRS